MDSLCLLLNCGILLLLTCGVDSATYKADEKEANSVFLAPQEAKSLLRKRRFNLKWFWGEEQEEEEEEERIKETKEFNQEQDRICRASCLTSWTGWSKCSVQCGSTGQSTRTRSVKFPKSCESRSLTCPGILSQRRDCNRSCKNGGVLQRFGCICPQGYKGTCCETRVTCGYPGHPLHGTVAPYGYSFFYNAVVTYSCDTGYKRSGSSTRKCLHTGLWSNSLPACQAITCTDPGTLLHGSRRGSSITYGSILVYSCYFGYELVGNRSQQCKINGQWSSSKPTCQAVSCPRLTRPQNGNVTFTSVTYHSVAEYSCNRGYYLSGSRQRRCQINKEWDGRQPSCQMITCKSESVTNGQVRSSTVEGTDRVPLGVVANTYCNQGYTLVGERRRSCEGTGPTGVWSSETPRCEAVNCGNPGIPQHSTRTASSGDSFVFPNKFQYKCLPGYFMTGTSEIQCRYTGYWSSRRPTCTACPVNTYKEGTDTSTTCRPCPVNSHTQGTTSPQVQHCTCDTGFRGPAGGPCTRITCPGFIFPPRVKMATCGHSYGESCELLCDAGYIRHRGDQMLTCNLEGKWSGMLPECSACPKNTFKEEETLCNPCPAHSSTLSEASVLSDCTCESGYAGPGGGPCHDINECLTNNGGCDQTCTNIEGSYRCRCTVPGYLRVANNPKKCQMKNSCTELAPPDNGGLVCLLDATVNTQWCSVKCNAGYDQVTRSNKQEECGPNTNWKWTSGLNEAPFLPCILSFIEGFQIDVETAYFTKSCHQLSADDIKLAERQFLDDLKKDVCSNYTLTKCSIGDVTISCGNLTSFDSYEMGLRRKRSASIEDGAVVQFKFSIEIDDSSNFNCTERMLECDEEFEECPTCGQLYLKQVERYFEVEKSALLTKFESAESRCLKIDNNGGAAPAANDDDVGVLHINGIALQKLCGVKIGNMSLNCDDGMEEKEGSCVPCPPGSYLNMYSKLCEYCPKGWYQPQQQQTSCLKCPQSKPYSTLGSATCYGPAPTTTPPLCKDYADVAILLDSSGSIQNGPTDGDHWEDILNFLASLAVQLKIGPDMNRLAGITFSDYAYLQNDFNDYQSGEAFANYVKEWKYLGRRTNTTGAFRMYWKELLNNTAAGDRPNMRNVIALITDGQTNIEAAGLMDEVNIVKRAGVTILAVGITDQISHRELLEIVSDPGYLYEVQDFNQLFDELNQILAGTCGYHRLPSN